MQCADSVQSLSDEHRVADGEPEESRPATPVLPDDIMQPAIPVLPVDTVQPAIPGPDDRLDGEPEERPATPVPEDSLDSEQPKPKPARPVGKNTHAFITK